MYARMKRNYQYDDKGKKVSVRVIRAKALRPDGAEGKGTIVKVEDSKAAVHAVKLEGGTPMKGRGKGTAAAAAATPSPGGVKRLHSGLGLVDPLLLESVVGIYIPNTRIDEVGYFG